MTRNRKPVLYALLGGIAAAVAILATQLNNTPTPVAVDETAAKPGTLAPAFSVTDSNGKVRNLSEFAGKYVVLEWLNHSCPFVKKHYSSGNMQKLQSDLTKDGVVWLSVISSATGKQGYSTPEQANQNTKEHKAAPSAVLLDADGTMGRAYGAQTTPQMVIIDPQGKLVYNGAIDSKPSTDVNDIEGADNYLLAALEQSRKGEPVALATTKPYGCSVKY